MKRQLAAQGRQQPLERFAQVCRARLSNLRKQDQELQEQVHAYEQRWSALSLQLLPFEATDQTEERDDLLSKHDKWRQSGWRKR